MKTITRAQIKWIKSLVSKTKRKQAEYFVVEGEKLVEEALINKHLKIHSIYAKEEWIAKKGDSRNTPFYCVTQEKLEKISTLKGGQLVLAIIRKNYHVQMDKTKNKWTLVLDDIQDPGNLGTIIRTCDWYSIRHILCSENCASQFNPKVIQASMGSLFNVNIQYTDIETWLRQQKQPIVVSSLNKKSISHKHKNLPKKGVLVLGNETKGVRSTIQDIAKYNVSIKSNSSTADSLNVAVACGIFLDYLAGNHSN